MPMTAAKTDLVIHILGGDPFTVSIDTIVDEEIRTVAGAFGRDGCNYRDPDNGSVSFYPPHRIDKIVWIPPDAPTGGIVYTYK